MGATRPRLFAWCAFVVAVLALAVLAGCGQSTYSFNVDPSGAAVLTVEIVPDYERYVVEEGAAQEIVRDMQRYDPSVTLEEFPTPVGTGYRVTLSNSDYRVLVGALLNPRSPDPATPAIKLFDRLSVERIERGMWQFLATMRPTMEILTAMGHGDIGELWPAGSSGYISVSLPGEVFSTNGEVVGPGTVRWNLSNHRNGETMELTTTGVPGDAQSLPGSPDPGSGDPGSSESAPRSIREQASLDRKVGIVAVIVGLTLLGLALLRKFRRRPARRDGIGPAPGYQAPGFGWQAPQSPSSPAAPSVPSLPSLASPTPAVPAPPPPLAPTPAVPAPPPLPSPAPPPPAPSGPAAGWYPDPRGEARHRWWSGTDWTDHTS